MLDLHRAEHGAFVFGAEALAALRGLPDASVDAIVTDPPYGLSNTNPTKVADTLTRWVTGEREYVPAGKGFMGKPWDAFVPPPALWDECYRVLKPGGHVLAFAGSRTHDLMTLSIRLAGFEIRDSVAWLYGSGFPKSLDVSKAIDKRRDWSLVGKLADAIRAARAETGLSLRQVGEAVKAASDGSHGEWYHRGGHMFFETGMSLPGRDEWAHLRSVLPIPAEFDAVYKEAEREVIKERRASDRRGDGTVVGLGHSGDTSITAPATPEAEQWQGWGTALKPAFEPVVMARKPLEGTVAANVLAHGTGALNVDGCRIGGGVPRPAREASGNDGAVYGAGLEGGRVTEDTTAGRWPANVVLDEDQAAELDAQTGTLTSGKMAAGTKPKGVRNTYGQDAAAGYETARDTPGDSGGASRFFYVAKAGKAERPRTEAGTAHPTVKPLKLMRWLVRMITPPGGLVLDPCAGSGTTGEAALLEGFPCILIEGEPDYLPLIDQRIDRAAEQLAAAALIPEPTPDTTTESEDPS